MRVFKKNIITLCLITYTFFSWAQIDIPNSLFLADVELRIQAKAKRKIAEKMNSLKRNRSHLKKYLDRCYLYLPLIQYVFKEEGIPEMFQYLAIQESALIPNAVSKSNAVGYWQFKKETGIECNLKINRQIDERKHILFSTHAAAKYLKNNYYFLNNWYATLLSYNMGLSGVKAYLNQKIPHKIVITSHTHFYILHFIAHWLVFEELVKEMENYEKTLLIYKNDKNIGLKKLAKNLAIPLERIKYHNQWLQGRGVVDKDDTILIPILKSRVSEVKKLLGEKNVYLQKPPKKETSFSLKSKIENASLYPIITGEKIINSNGKKITFVTANNIDALKIQAGVSLDFISSLVNISKKKLIRINEIGLLDDIYKINILYLKRKKRKAHTKFHVLKPEEDIWQVSQRYGIRKKKILRYNRLKHESEALHGQVLWLQSRRPKNVGVEIRDTNTLEEEDNEYQIEEETTSNPFKEEEETTLQKEKNLTQTPVNQEKTDIIEVNDSIPSQKNNSILFEQIDLNTHMDEKDFQKNEKEEDIKDEIIKNRMPFDAVKDNYDTLLDKEIKQTRERLHRVRKGETLYAIAKKYNIDIENVKNYNTMENNHIQENQMIKIPPITPSISFNTNKKIHEVSKGETIYSIAKKYETTPENILQENKLNNSYIFEGQKLYISIIKKEDPFFFHIVKEKETLFKIASIYKTTIEEIQKWNSMKDTQIQKGEKIKIFKK